MSTSEPEEQTISTHEIGEFVQKLESWGKALTDKEQILLQVILARAEGAPVDTRVEIKELAKSTANILRSAEQIRMHMRAWVRGGPGWMRWASRSS